MSSDPAPRLRRDLLRHGVAATAGLGLGGIAGRHGRAEDAPPGREEFVIATVVDRESGTPLQNGAQLAIDAVNASGGILKRRLRLRTEVTNLTRGNIRAAAIDVASRVVGEDDLIAVIGHHAVADALPAAITYLRRDAVLITPGISTTALTMHGLKNLFAMLPDNAELSTQTARFVANLGNRRAMILRERGVEALEVSLAYRDAAAKLQITIADEASLPSVHHVRNVTPRLQALKIDHVVLICPLDWQIEIVRFITTLGLNVLCVLPTIENAVLVQKELTRALGATTSAPFRNRVLMPVLRDPRSPTPTQAEWERAYQERFRIPASDYAMQGTDAVGVIVEALRIVGRIGSPGQDVAGARKELVENMIRVMHGELAYRGVGGRMSFRRNGRMYTRMLGFASIRSPEERDTAYYLPGA
ncbi:MAG: ABC transporter substrate-binding protein [Paracraurococcus sp.]|jgi:ABC-type branched-subunit amino acid transport system substrate-binding protein